MEQTVQNYLIFLKKVIHIHGKSFVHVYKTQILKILVVMEFKYAFKLKITKLMFELMKKINFQVCHSKWPMGQITHINNCTVHLYEISNMKILNSKIFSFTKNYELIKSDLDMKISGCFYSYLTNCGDILKIFSYMII